MCFVLSFNCIAQERWSLMSCIEYANKNNVGLLQSKLLVNQAEINVKESKYKRLPNLNGSLNAGKSFGRNVDPITNAFVTQEILYSNYSLSSSMVLFQGGTIRNSIKQNQLILQSANMDYEQASIDLSLNIVIYYLNILQSQERLLVADKNREIAKLQLDQINKLIKAGVKPEADALELQSQIARAEQTYVISENALDVGWLSLKQAMRLTPETKMTIETLSDDQLNSLQLEKYSYEDLFNQASENRPGIQAAKYKLESAIVGEKISRSLYYPTVLLSGSIGSRFSDAAKRPTKDYTIVKDTIEGVINNTQIQFIQDFKVPFTEITPFKTQFDQFLGYGAGVSVSIPIFNNYFAKANVQRAKLNTMQSELQLELQKEKLSQDIYQAMTNVKAAIKDFDASQNVYNASKSSFEKTQKRFDIGMANVFELNQIQTNYLNAQTSLLISKYDLVFKQKILDYYAGKKIRL